MDKYKKIAVFEKIEKGDVACMCMRSHKMCDSTTCEKDVVLKDKYYRWQDTFGSDKYGRSKNN